MIKKFSKTNVLFYVLFQLILIVGVLLRFSDLARRSLWLDEIWSLSFYNSSIPFSKIVTFSVSEYFPPLYNILLWGSFHVLGETVEVGRGVSAIFGVLTLPFFYLLTKEYTKNQWAGLVVMAAVSFNPYLVHYSREMRGYSAMLFFVIAGYYYLLKFLRDERKGSLLLWGLCVVFTLNIHFFAWLPFFHQISWYLRCRSQKEWKGDFLKLGPMVLVGVIFPFWVSVRVLRDFAKNNFISSWIGSVGTWDERLSVVFFEWTGLFRAELGYALLVGVAFFVVIKSSDRLLIYKRNFFLIEGMLILGATFFIDYFYKPILISRYFIPTFCILVVGLVGFVSQAPKIPRTIFLLLFFLLFSFDGVRRVGWQSWSNDYRAYIGWLSMQRAENKIYYFGSQQYGIERYAQLLGVPVTLYQIGARDLGFSAEPILVTSDQSGFLTNICPEFLKVAQVIDRDKRSFFYAWVRPGFKCKL